MYSRVKWRQYAMLCLVAQLCPTLCNPMNYRPPGSSVRGDSPGKNAGVGCLSLLQGVFPTQGLNPGLPHCWWILYLLSHCRSPKAAQYQTNVVPVASTSFSGCVGFAALLGWGWMNREIAVIFLTRASRMWHSYTGVVSKHSRNSAEVTSTVMSLKLRAWEPECLYSEILTLLAVWPWGRCLTSVELCKRSIVIVLSSQS